MEYGGDKKDSFFELKFTLWRDPEGDDLLLQLEQRLRKRNGWSKWKRHGVVTHWPAPQDQAVIIEQALTSQNFADAGFLL